MFLIKCPWCGDRDMVEFTYGGDATKKHPEDMAAASLDEWNAYVYERDNPCGPHWEYWHHVNGCRQWLMVHRDTLTHEILETATPTEKDVKKPWAGKGEQA
ncbi:MAG: sarcosine oxidase subunit delta [Alphaproteobacteria bacterium]